MKHAPVIEDVSAAGDHFKSNKAKHHFDCSVRPESINSTSIDWIQKHKYPLRWIFFAQKAPMPLPDERSEKSLVREQIHVGWVFRLGWC